MLLHGIDTGREAALDDGVEIIGGSHYIFITIEFPAKRVDFVATDFYKIAITFTTIFSSAQHGIVSELVVCGEVVFYLCVLG